MITTINEFRKTIKESYYKNYSKSRKPGSSFYDSPEGRDKAQFTSKMTNDGVTYFFKHLPSLDFKNRYENEDFFENQGWKDPIEGPAFVKHLIQLAREASSDVANGYDILWSQILIKAFTESKIAKTKTHAESIYNKYFTGKPVIYDEPTVDKPVNTVIPTDTTSKSSITNTVNFSTLSTKQISEATGLTSSVVNNTLERLGLMSKTGSNWTVTDAGIEKGGKQLTGKFGDFVVWPISIIEIVKEANKLKESSKVHYFKKLNENNDSNIPKIIFTPKYDERRPTNQDEQYDVNYQITVNGVEIEIEGILKPYDTGRGVDYEFELGQCIDESEEYYDENSEQIEKQIIDEFYNQL